MAFPAIYEALRSRLFYKALDATLTAELHPVRSWRGRLLIVFNPLSSHYERTGSLFNLLDSSAPFLTERLLRGVRRSEKLPVEGMHAKPCGYGAGATVYRIARPHHPLVLKVYRPSLGRNRDHLCMLARWQKRMYEAVRSWYQEVTELIVPTRFVVLHVPPLNVPAVGFLQDFIDGTRSDFFQDNTDEHLLRLFARDEVLRRQFLAFSEATRRVARSEGRCVDLLGRENLLLVEEQIGHRLRLIDHSVFVLERKRHERPDVHARTEAYLDRLAALQRAAC